MNIDFGKTLILIGAVIVIAGIIVIAASRFGINLGKLPGDISIKKDNYSFHFPIVSSIIVSIVLTVLLNFFFRK